MPPLPPVPKVIKLRLMGHFTTGVPWGIQDFWRYGGQTPTATEMDQFADNAHQAVQQNLLSHWTSDVLFEEVQAIDLSGPTSAVGIWTGALAGTGSSGALPDSICVLETKKCALKYRGGHPRTYWPALAGTANQADGRTWNPGLLQAWATSHSAYLQNIIGFGDLQPYGPIQRSAVHYKGQHVGITYPFVEDVLAASHENVFATQRRRIGR